MLAPSSANELELIVALIVPEYPSVRLKSGCGVMAIPATVPLMVKLERAGLTVNVVLSKRRGSRKSMQAIRRLCDRAPRRKFLPPPEAISKPRIPRTDFRFMDSLCFPDLPSTVGVDGSYSTLDPFVGKSILSMSKLKTEN